MPIITDPHVPGTPSWLDISSSDLDRTIAFYQGLFGWTSERGSAEFGGYTTFSKDGQPVAGAAGKRAEDPSPVDYWGLYLATVDIDADTARAVDKGATALYPPMQVAEFGKMAGLVDPSGAVVSLWQPGSHTGFGVHDEPGAPSWFELASRDVDAAKTFYADWWGWTYDEATEVDMAYTTASVNGQMAAGLMDATPFLPEGVPSHWSFYVCVADMRAILAKVTELGGQVIQGPDESPFGLLAAVTDNAGATFKLQELPKG